MFIQIKTNKTQNPAIYICPISFERNLKLSQHCKIMFPKKAYLLLLLITIISVAWKTTPEDWMVEKHNTYNLLYKPEDAGNKTDYIKLIDKGIKTVD